MPVAGYNIAFKLDPSSTGDPDSAVTIAGRTQDDLTIAARTKESLTKDDQGATQVAITGHDVTFRATGLIDVTGSYNRDDLIDLMLSGDPVDFFYEVDGGAAYTAYTGTCVMTNYSESSNASDDATFTADFRVSGDLELYVPGE